MAKKITEISNWPSFNWNQEIISPILDLLKQDQARLLDQITAMSPDLQKEANFEILMADILALLPQLGNLPAAPQFKSLLSQKLGEAKAFGPAPSEHSLNALVEMVVEVQQNYKAPLTKDRLMGWFEKMGSNQPSQNWEQAEKQLDLFLNWFNKPGLERLLKAAIAHIWFLAICPFEENAIFIANLITEIQLAKADKTDFRFYSLSSELNQEKNNYQFIIEQTLQGSLDITIWLQWFLNCITKSYNTSYKTLSGVLHKDAFWKKHKNIPLNNRQQKVLKLIVDGVDIKLNSAYYAVMAGCSRDTALRDLTDLMEKNILYKVPGGLGKNTIYAPLFSALLLASSASL